MTIKEKKKLLRAFVIIYLFVFLLFNWDDVSWIFNYDFIKRAMAGFFQAKSHHALSNFDQEGNSSAERKDISDYSSKENSIEILKIGISAPLVVGSSLDITELTRDLDRGAVYYPASVLPGQRGQTIILGHSAPPNWPKIKYDWVFSNISELERGDTIYIYFNNKKYSYRVKTKVFLGRGEEILENNLTDVSNVLILVSCWPPGKDLKRIAVKAELIS